MSTTGKYQFPSALRDERGLTACEALRRGLVLRDTRMTDSGRVVTNGYVSTLGGPVRVSATDAARDYFAARDAANARQATLAEACNPELLPERVKLALASGDYRKALSRWRSSPENDVASEGERDIVFAYLKGLCGIAME